MKKVLVSLTFIGAIAMISCNKEEVETTSFEQDVVEETETIRLSESGFETNEAVPLSNEIDNVFTEGVLEYVKDGDVLGTFDYSKEGDEMGEFESDGEKKECHLKKKGKKGKFKKVITRPLVKTDDCEYIVAGIIEYYDTKTGELMATIDFGDGTCDDLAIKTTPDGEEHVFSLSEHMHK